ncbi:hypothetical protein LTR84_004180 [Exophiala bonariae]|uniref:Uncharacterized protein n=1 Tax=Exophiala bonariae TaxID=1690606 RepID=A0AAV9N5I3_9EURO|nr:hypothetical protein LTR84_004180 [Exophiala bonariae]
MAGKHHRGRSTTTKEATAAKSSINEVPIFDPVWFSGDPDMEIDTREAIEPPRKMGSYPPYLQARLGKSKIMGLVKGSICQRIMRLYTQEDLDMVEISKALGTSKVDGGLQAADVESIILACEAFGLGSESPLEAEYWENTSIEGWWERSYCEELSRNEPIGPEVAGYDCEQGWWANKSDAKNRDWDWFAETPEIGPGKRPEPR